MAHLRLGLLLIGLFLAAGAWAAHAESGIASVYGGGGAASGERENSSVLTAASGFADQLKRDKNSELDVMAINEIRRRKSRGAKGGPGDNV